MTSDDRQRHLVAYSAMAWWTGFAALSFYWAAGGTMGLSSLGEGIETLATEGETWFLLLVALTGVLKLVPVVLLVSLVREVDLPVPMWILPVLVAIIGILSFLYGAIAVVQKLLVQLGVITVYGIDTAAFWGHLLIWDPIWIIGGLLLIASGWLFHRAGVTRR